VAAVIFGRFIRKYSKNVQDQVAESQVIEETMQGISVVKAFANEWYEIARYNGKIKEVVKIAIKEVNIEGTLLPSLFSVFSNRRRGLVRR
jgi:ABC-type multidrug transport system fused ATPase/permease subunit